MIRLVLALLVFACFLPHPASSQVCEPGTECEKKAEPSKKSTPETPNTGEKRGNELGGSERPGRLSRSELMERLNRTREMIGGNVSLEAWDQSSFERETNIEGRLGNFERELKFDNQPYRFIAREMWCEIKGAPNRMLEDISKILHTDWTAIKALLNDKAAKEEMIKIGGPINDHIESIVPHVIEIMSPTPFVLTREKAQELMTQRQRYLRKVIMALKNAWDKFEQLSPEDQAMILSRALGRGFIDAEIGLATAAGVQRLSPNRVRGLFDSAPDFEIIESYNAFNKGPLASSKYILDPRTGLTVAESFGGGTYSLRRATAPMKLYRVYDFKQKDRRWGNFWTRVKPEGRYQATLDLGISPSFQNPATGIVEIKIPPGTMFYEGTANGVQWTDSVGNAVGTLSAGGNQVFLDFPAFQIERWAVNEGKPFK